MATIYCIEDINDLKYVGSTTMTLRARLSGHRMDKKLMKGCSSEKLNLSYCIIYELERCNKQNRYQREKYWIDNTVCVNKNKMEFNRLEYLKKYAQNRYVNDVISSVMNAMITQIELNQDEILES